jgi:hypothetical protein
MSDTPLVGQTKRLNTTNMNKQRILFRERCELEDARCWLCGQSIDYTVPSSSTVDSFELDHFYTVSEHPELQEDPANFRPSHMLCNRNRGNGPPAPALGSLSRVWFPDPDHLLEAAELEAADQRRMIES